MFEFILLFIFFYWLINKLGKDRKKRRFRKPSLDQELKDLILADDNSTGIALSVKQYLLDVLDDDKNDREKYSDTRLAQGQEILDKAGASALYFMADIATQLSLVAAAQINKIPTSLDNQFIDGATPEAIINKVIKI
jgi:hypothetical protein